MQRDSPLEEVGVLHQPDLVPGEELDAGDGTDAAGIER